MHLNIVGVAHLPMPEVLCHSTMGDLSGFLVKLHDVAINASKEHNTIIYFSTLKEICQVTGTVLFSPPPPPHPHL